MPETVARLTAAVRSSPGRALMWLAAGGQLEALLAMVGAVVAVRVLGGTGAGTVFLAQALATLWLRLCDPRLEDAFQRYAPVVELESPERVPALHRDLMRLDLLLGLGACVLGAALVVGLDAAEALPTGLDAGLLSLALASAGAAGVSGFAASGFSVAGRLELLARLRAVLAVGSFALSALGVVVAGPVGLLAGQLLGQTVAAIVLCVIARRLLRARFGLPPRLPRPRPHGLVSFTVSSSAATALALGTDAALVVVAGVVGGPSTATVVKVCLAPARLFASLVSPVVAVLHPRLSQAAARCDWAGFARDVRAATALLAGLGLAATGLGIALLGPVLRLLYGAEYADLWPAAAGLLAAAAVRGAVAWSKVLPLALGAPAMRLRFLAVDGVAMLGGLSACLLWASGVGAFAVYSVVVAALAAWYWWRQVPAPALRIRAAP